MIKVSMCSKQSGFGRYAALRELVRDAGLSGVQPLAAFLFANSFVAIHVSLFSGPLSFDCCNLNPMPSTNSFNSGSLSAGSPYSRRANYSPGLEILHSAITPSMPLAYCYRRCISLRSQP
jgi:hypothetical protein